MARKKLAKRLRRASKHALKNYNRLVDKGDYKKALRFFAEAQAYAMAASIASRKSKEWDGMYESEGSDDEV